MSAVQSIKGETFVFVRTADGFEARQVVTGRYDSRRVEILRGLSIGDKIATANTFVLKADLGKAEIEHEE